MRKLSTPTAAAWTFLGRMPDGCERAAESTLDGLGEKHPSVHTTQQHHARLWH